MTMETMDRAKNILMEELQKIIEDKCNDDAFRKKYQDTNGEELSMALMTEVLMQVSLMMYIIEKNDKLEGMSANEIKRQALIYISEVLHRISNVY